MTPKNEAQALKCYDCGRELSESQVTLNFGNRPLCKGGCPEPAAPSLPGAQEVVRRIAEYKQQDLLTPRGMYDELRCFFCGADEKAEHKDDCIWILAQASALAPTQPQPTFGKEVPSATPDNLPMRSVPESCVSVTEGSGKTPLEPQPQPSAELLDLDAEKATMASCIATIGGEVEGNPTGRHNFLQRLRELIKLERVATLQRAYLAQSPEDRTTAAAQRITELEQQLAEARAQVLEKAQFIKNKCAQYWNALGTSNAEIHAALEWIHSHAAAIERASLSAETERKPRLNKQGIYIDHDETEPEPRAGRDLEGPK